MTVRTSRQIVKRIIGAYDSFLVRTYARIRFVILRQRFMEEIEQYLPSEGRVIDIGCGFGLFALYFAQRKPNLKFEALDLNPRRIQLAESVAAKLGVENVKFAVGDAREFVVKDEIDAAYLMDLIHHIPRERVPELLKQVVAQLRPGGRIILKDVENRPWHKKAFTWLLDKAMDYSAPVDYWSQKQVLELLSSLGLRAYRHAMVDFLPYPHVIYVGWKD